MPEICSAVRSRNALAGAPRIILPSPNALSSVTSAPAPGAVEQNGAHADQAVITDTGAVDDHAVTDGDAASDGHGLSRIGVNDAMILHIRVRPDCDPVIVAAQHRAEPDACTLHHANFPDQHRIGCNPATV